MWWSRRSILAALPAVAACGFAPAEGPGSAGRALRDSVLPDAPATREGFDFAARIEDRLGRADPARYRLAYTITTEAVPGGITAAGTITRYTLTGRADWRLEPAGGGAALAEGRAEGMTGWFTTSTTVAAQAAEADARRRLMAILADRVVADLYAAALP